MKPQRRFPLKLAAGLVAAIVFDTALQLTWKTTVLEVPGESSFLATLGAVFSNPLFAGVVFLMACQFFNWLMVLAEADLSYAKPVASLSFASVPAMSALLLHEAFDVFKVFGVLFVIIGVWFISQTDHQTSKRDLN